MSRFYCIGKATRRKPMEIVTSPPYDACEPYTMYKLLRVACFATIKQAEAAAVEAKKYNPVGFVVLVVDELPTENKDTTS